MTELEQLGKRRTILVSISILMVSIHTIYFYHATVPNVTAGKIIQQIIRFILTAGLLALIYNGKNWARIIAIILFSIGTLGALMSLFTLDTHIVSKIPLVVMTFVYSIAIFHFGFTESFKAFKAFLNENK